MTGERQRADRLLVERGHFESRARAQAAIEAGLVSADGRPVARASDRIAAGARIDARAPHPYVSRGGVKLAAALDAFGLDPRGLVCLDVGASTGGFTDVLLRRGAAHVYAVDVGRDQLHPALRDNPQVTSLEGTDARGLDRGAIPLPPDLMTVDVSFISLRLVLPALVPLLAPDARLAALVKPQFEAGRERIGRGGIVRDEAVHAAVCAEVRACLEGLGVAVLGLVPSPVEGGDGNREFLIGGRRGEAA
ncbi:TlyA family RNA methyltransferase [Methylobacterium oxalidis]|uniref:TlyA family rRNA (Cytidine-2'-O)-methyltransferase n=1 Tax=Methylobacterium oxalidis TaxID=944322 RepID=A0A512IWL1_9HYPH|nr:TlyA family RNA methyltransferase [Methylobacterium oxalidis]GEP02107.1 TlyA family rRNA (cytidine-2'-O)-methyltransferase [Methylobacterium oxalidis]GJE35658.1 16S/23S rRNA (cytidine-2'-O)-methyltransferase TlyA [Methylobacterium oxalidis]GLS62052.1 TlyA family rRNA (cytidine-2'-O)-methyltransferase [Methylobacterium oxalidis]